MGQHTSESWEPAHQAKKALCRATSPPAPSPHGPALRPLLDTHHAEEEARRVEDAPPLRVEDAPPRRAEPRHVTPTIHPISGGMSAVVTTAMGQMGRVPAAIADVAVVAAGGSRTVPPELRCTRYHNIYSASNK